MFLIVTKHNRSQYEAQLTDMFRLRHRIFVDLLGWKELRREDGLEFDEFDHLDSLYCIVWDTQHEKTTGFLRLSPTLAPSLTAAKYSHKCNFEPIPSGETVYDISRMAVDPENLSKSEQELVGSQLICGMYEIGLAMDLSNFVGISNVRHMQKNDGGGGSTVQLGDTWHEDGQDYAAAKYIISYRMLAMIKETRNFHRQVLSGSDVGLLRATHRLFLSEHYGAAKVA